jgi:hypothetical protein
MNRSFFSTSEVSFFCVFFIYVHHNWSVLVGSRTLLFSSPTQLRLLAEADEWGTDANFVVPKRIMQRLVIIAYIRRMPQGPSRELVPFEAAVAYMERRRVVDYEPVFQAIKNSLPAERRDAARRIVQGEYLLLSLLPSMIKVFV